MVAITQNKDLLRFLENKLTASELNAGLRDLFGSPHMRTKFLNNPGMASHHQLLWLSSKTGTSAHRLYEQYGIGKNTISSLEAEQLKLVEVLTFSPSGRAVAA